jgi:hypothetical protein
MFHVQEAQICLVQNYFSLNRKANFAKPLTGIELPENKKGIPKNALHPPNSWC